MADDEDRKISHQNELRDHRHLLASLRHAHARSLQAGLLSTLARPPSQAARDPEQDAEGAAGDESLLKGDPAGMDVDSDDEDDAPPAMQVLSQAPPPAPALASSSSSSSRPAPLHKVHPQSTFTLFPVHQSQLPPPPAFSLPDEILALANAHLRACDPPSEVPPAHAPGLTAAASAVLDDALLAVAGVTSAVGNYSERERARQRAKEREREDGGWLRVVHAMGTMPTLPEAVRRNTLARLEALYGPSPALKCAYDARRRGLQAACRTLTSAAALACARPTDRPPPPDHRPPLPALDQMLGIPLPPPPTAPRKGRGKDKKKRKVRAFNPLVKSQPLDASQQQVPPPPSSP